LIVLLALGVAYGGSRVFAIALVARDGEQHLAGLERASAIAPSIWRYHYDLGLLARAVGRYEQALGRLDAAIARFPSCGICWVARAETEAAMGADPRQSILKAVDYGRSQTGVRTRTAVLYAKLGEHDEALREFGAAAGGQVDNIHEFFSALHQLYETQAILDEVVSDTQLKAYFTYARQYLDAESVSLIWQRFRELEESTAHVSYYAGDLLRRGNVHAAWSTTFGPDVPVAVDLFDGGFDGQIDRRPWGWRIENGDGVRARVTSCSECEEGGRALHLEFDGESNPHYLGVSQYLPVLPGAVYLLEARVRYEGLTSARGPALAILGVPRPAETSEKNSCHFWTEGEPLLLTSDWRVTQLAFPIPTACEGIRVMVARPQTKKLNRHIAGELWVDHIHLRILTMPPQLAEQPEKSPALASFPPDD
jgi:tetratricopeptide (TPR) repeat protein